MSAQRGNAVWIKDAGVPDESTGTLRLAYAAAAQAEGYEAGETMAASDWIDSERESRVNHLTNTS